MDPNTLNFYPDPEFRLNLDTDSDLGLCHGGINMERPRGLNCTKTGGGRTLCTLHRGEGLYG